MIKNPKDWFKVVLPCLLAIYLSACGDKQETDSSESTVSQPVELPSAAESMPANNGADNTPQMDPQTTADSGTASDQAAQTAEATTTAESSNGDTNSSANEAALKLAKISGCLACHSVDKKIVGPAWKDVSVRYKDDPDARNKLIDKVKKGGTGNWTAISGGAAMPPYYPRVSEENIAKLVEFVLSLK